MCKNLKIAAAIVNQLFCRVVYETSNLKTQKTVCLTFEVENASTSIRYAIDQLITPDRYIVRVKRRSLRSDTWHRFCGEDRYESLADVLKICEFRAEGLFVEIEDLYGYVVAFRLALHHSPRKLPSVNLLVQTTLSEQELERKHKEAIAEFIRDGMLFPPFEV